MIISKLEFLDRAKLDPETLDVWIEEEWLIPGTTGTGTTFSEADIARARLILDLIHDLRVNEEGVGVILHLLDQMHGLRKALSDMRQFARARALPHHTVLLMSADQRPE